jgi:membrane associated rhomboid family serine protease
MGIYDREYVRVGPRSVSGLGSLRFVSVNSWLIIANIAVFVLGVLAANITTFTPMQMALRKPVPSQHLVSPPQFLNNLGERVRPEQVGVGGTVYRLVVDNRTGEVVGSQEYTRMPLLYAWGHFSTALGFFGLQLWRFITFQFLHAGPTHLLFNMFGLWVFGGMVEQYLGSRRYLAFYLTCGIFGAVCYLILNFLGNLFPGTATVLLNDSIHTPLVGASAGVFGVILACAYIAPNAMVMLIFPPVPLKLKWLAYAYVAFA